MDRDRENLWTRRSNTNKLSISGSNYDSHESRPESASKGYAALKRFASGDGSSHSRSNPFNAIAPLNTNNASSPSSAASTAFGLGSGAFASFGTPSKTPKTAAGTPFDFGKPADRRERSASKGESMSARKPGAGSQPQPQQQQQQQQQPEAAPWPLRYSWVIWYRPPTSKHSDYEKSIKPLCRMGSAQDFWRIYVHLNRPSKLPAVSDYHFFKDGIRPVWEDDENKKGGKWIMRLKKGVSDRYWEDLLLALVGDQFGEAGSEVCGAVLSVRSNEDIFSVWTKKDGGRNVKIRETIKHVLSLPSDTIIVWKSHDDSIAQRSAIDQARHEKVAHSGADKRRLTIGNSNDDKSAPGRDRLGQAES